MTTSTETRQTPVDEAHRQQSASRRILWLTGPAGALGLVVAFAGALVIGL